MNFQSPLAQRVEEKGARWKKLEGHVHRGPRNNKLHIYELTLKTDLAFVREQIQRTPVLYRPGYSPSSTPKFKRFTRSFNSRMGHHCGSDTLYNDK